MKLIDKDALVAEIEKLKGKVSDGSSYCNGWQQALRMLELSFNNLEVKEIDLEKEIDNFGLHYDGIVLDRKELIEFAKHFFELGLKAQKDNIRHSMNETPKYPCDILFVTEVDTMFLFKYMKNGRPVDRETPYFHNIQNGKCWYYCNDIMNIY